MVLGGESRLPRKVVSSMLSLFLKSGAGKSFGCGYTNKWEPHSGFRLNRHQKIPPLYPCKQQGPTTTPPSTGPFLYSGRCHNNNNKKKRRLHRHNNKYKTTEKEHGYSTQTKTINNKATIHHPSTQTQFSTGPRIRTTKR